MIEPLQIPCPIKNTIKCIRVVQKLVYFLVKDCLHMFTIDTKECITIANGVSCFDISNNSDVIIGESSGKMKVVFANCTTSTVAHWHSQRVNKALCINNGSSVLSGGNEVIV